MAEHTELTGQTIQGYHIHKPIGQGKFSIVYRAETTNKSIVALKKIKIFDILDPKQREKCLKEVKLMQPLDHPNIIKYIDSFIHNNELIIITEWAEKGDLKKLIKNAIQEETPFEEIKIWEFSLQIAGALKQMHEKRIMHRDLKPANIFIAQDGNLKVGDLGLGRIFSSETIEAYSKVGTPLYMSPELLRGEGYDMKSDVWSLGCVLYELCEFKSPFRNENEKMSLMDLFNKITKGEFKPLSNKYSEELRQLVNNMIMIDPQRRPDMNMVCQISEQMFNYWKKTPKIDSILVMEDIYEKLGILEYHSFFCNPLNKKPISRLCFAVPENELSNQDKFYYFVALCYWIINLPKFSNKSQASQTQNIKEIFNSKRSNDEIANKLLLDIKNSGIRLGDQINVSYLTIGYGDTICFLLNDLLNRELIRLNYKFESPNFTHINEENNENNENFVEEEPDVKNYEITANHHLSDEEDEPSIPNKKMAVKSVFHQNNNNNSRFTSATTRADEIEDYGKFKTKKDELEEIDVGRNIMESNIEPNAWKKEFDKVSKQLEDFDELVAKNPDDLSKEYEKDDFKTYLRELNLSSIKIKNDIKDLKQNGIEKFTEKISKDVEAITYGEKIINNFSSNYIGKLKDMVENQKKLFGDLNKKTQTMTQKISDFDVLNNKFMMIKQELDKKGNYFDGNKEMFKIQEAIKTIKQDIKGLNFKQGLIENQLIKFKRQYNQEKTQI